MNTKTLLTVGVVALIGLGGFIAWNKYKTLPGSRPQSGGGQSSAPGGNPAAINTSQVIGDVTKWGIATAGSALNDWLSGNG